jgi:nucleoid DNA-binding protein
MGIKELAALIVEKHPDLTTAKAMSVLRVALEGLNKELETTTEASVRLAPLGQFKLHERTAKAGEAEAAPEGEGETKKKPLGRRILLRLMDPKVIEERASKAKTKKADRPERVKGAGKGAGKRATKAAVAE